MRLPGIALSSTLLTIVTLCPLGISAQTVNETVRRRVEAARDAAGQDHAFVFGRLCAGPIQAVGAPPVVGAVPSALPSIDPDRTWYADKITQSLRQLSRKQPGRRRGQLLARPGYL